MDSANADRPNDDLSTAFGTETLAERDMIPRGFANTPTSRTDIHFEVIGGGRYLRVDQNANLRALGDATIEASKCLKACWDQGLITRD